MILIKFKVADWIINEEHEDLEQLRDWPLTMTSGKNRKNI